MLPASNTGLGDSENVTNLIREVAEFLEIEGPLLYVLTDVPEHH
jgi:hypothetical protein